MIGPAHHRASRRLTITAALAEVQHAQADRDRYREGLREALAAARVFNQRGMSWQEYDALLARLEALDG